MKKIFILLIIISLAGSFVYSRLQKHFYKTISQEQLVATIRCARSTDKNYDFYLSYIPAQKNAQADFKLIKCRGTPRGCPKGGHKARPYWAFEGEIIKWKRPLNILGFKTAHRPIRIYDSAGNSCYLDVGARHAVPLHFFKIARLLPIVDTSFISIIKQPFIPKTKFGVYATNTGYLVRRIK